MWVRIRRALVLAVVLVVGAGCGDDVADGGTGGVDGNVVVFAAASLADVFEEVEAAFEDAYPDADVQLNLAGSSALREQILQGAPADVFASADESNLHQVVEAGDAASEPRTFARNILQIAVPTGNPGRVSGLEDLADGDLLVGLCAEGVPCGDLARASLDLAGVEASIDTNEPDVRALLTKIDAGELDAGIVYVTDVTSAGDRVAGIDIPPEHNVEARYPIVVLAGSPNPEGAAAFVELVLSDAGQGVMARHGFTDP